MAVYSLLHEMTEKCQARLQDARLGAASSSTSMSEHDLMVRLNTLKEVCDNVGTNFFA